MLFCRVGATGGPKKVDKGGPVMENPLVAEVKMGVAFPAVAGDVPALKPNLWVMATAHHVLARLRMALQTGNPVPVLHTQTIVGAGEGAGGEIVVAGGEEPRSMLLKGMGQHPAS